MEENELSRCCLPNEMSDTMQKLKVSFQTKNMQFFFLNNAMKCYNLFVAFEFISFYLVHVHLFVGFIGHYEDIFDSIYDFIEFSNSIK